MDFFAARGLAPILPQFIGLSVHNIVEAQVPYFLQAISKNPLPHLKSLEIFLTDAGFGVFNENGAAEHFGLQYFENFIPSIALASPGLEELVLHGKAYEPSVVVSQRNRPLTLSPSKLT